MLQKLNDQSKKLFLSIPSWIKSLKTYWGIILPIILIALLILLGRAAYLRWGLQRGWADWTGLGSFVVTDEKLQRGKTLWDWLELLIIPFVLALGAWWLQRSERDSDRKLAEERRQDDQNRAKDQQQETALQDYIDKMTELLLDQEHPLRETGPKDEVRVVARTRTLATLRGLDPARKGMLLKFLHEAELIAIGKSKNDGEEKKESEVMKRSIINLRGADLSEANLNEAMLLRADLRGVNLSKADLSEANLVRVDLSGANLIKANLIRAELSGANLREANLVKANLHDAMLLKADLRFANLLGANLSEAFMDGTHMSGVILTGSNLREADLSGAKLFKANLSEADLSEADLSGSDLSEAVLSKADLSRANLRGVNLKGADLSGANLSSADLRGANLSEACLYNTILKNTTMPDGEIYDPIIHSIDKNGLYVSKLSEEN